MDLKRGRVQKPQEANPLESSVWLDAQENSAAVVNPFDLEDQLSASERSDASSGQGCGGIPTPVARDVVCRMNSIWRLRQFTNPPKWWTTRDARVKDHDMLRRYCWPMPFDPFYRQDGRRTGVGLARDLKSRALPSHDNVLLCNERLLVDGWNEEAIALLVGMDEREFERWIELLPRNESFSSGLMS